jgi:hypothetical protein
MSKTKRKIGHSKRWGTEKLYIESRMERFEGFEYKRVKKTKQEYERDLALYGYASKRKTIKVPISREKRIEQLKQEFARYTRDGVFADGRKKYFKYLSKRRVRMNTKKYLNEYKNKGENYTPKPSWHDGDYLAWTVW